LLLNDADLFADGGDGIADLADGALQFGLCDFQMLHPAANGRWIIHRYLPPGAAVFDRAGADHPRGPRPQWCMNKARRRMIGSGMPMSQSNAPFPKDMIASVWCFRGRISLSGSAGSFGATFMARAMSDLGEPTSRQERMRSA
jgi:hypothetical protein